MIPQPIYHVLWLRRLEPRRPGLAAFALFEIFRKISQNFSPAGVTSPFVARAMPTDTTSVVPVSGR